MNRSKFDGFRQIDIYSIVATTVITIVAFVAIVFTSFYANAEEANAPNLDEFWSAIAANNWPLAVGLGLTVLVWVVRGFGLLKKIPKKILPWVSLILAVAGTTGTRIVQACSESRPWWQGMVQGIIEGSTMGFVSMGIWDTKQTVAKSKSE